MYHQFVEDLNVNPDDIVTLEHIPFLPISAFRHYKVLRKGLSKEVIFESSGTSGSTTSKLHLHDIAWYQQNVEQGFTSIYGDPKSYCWMALLPSYLERKNSSLVYMVDHFIRHSKYEQSGFFLDNLNDLQNKLKEVVRRKIPTILIGVSFALLDFAENYAMDLSSIVVMETGGMKGRRREIPRFELHDILKEKLHLKSVHSEYGMTELLSQAYSKGDGVFVCSPTMKIIVKDLSDPFALNKMGKSGVLNVIDLANVEQCSFIETSDIGIKMNDDRFQVLGRLDHAMLRGCNLLYQV